VDRTGSFFYALAYIALVAAIGALSYVFIVGEVRRVTMEQPQS
jgi:ACS family D-galactonate transporter-like MFS transporter